MHSIKKGASIVQKQPLLQISKANLIPIKLPIECFYHDVKQIRLPQEKMPFFHYHTVLEIGICQRGTGILFSPDKSVLINPGDIVFLPPKTFHHFESINTDPPCLCVFSYMDLYTILFSLIKDNDTVNNMIKNISLYDIPKVFKKKENREMHHVLKNFLNDMFSEMPNKKLILATHLSEFLIKTQYIYPKIVQSQSHNYNPDDRMTTIVDYIQSNYMKDIDIKQLCSISYLSESQLRRLFKNTYGTSPIKYLSNLRCKISCQLLIYSDMSIQAISQRVGFNDVSGFYKHFTSIYNISPTSYRAKYSQTS